MIAAAGVMGWPEEQFNLTEPAYFIHAYNAWIKSKYEGEKNEWERARYAAFFAVMPHVKKGAIKQPSDLGKFPWEQTAPKFAPVDPDVMKAWHEKAKERLLKKK